MAENCISCDLHVMNMQNPSCLLCLTVSPDRGDLCPGHRPRHSHRGGFQGPSHTKIHGPL